MAIQKSAPRPDPRDEIETNEGIPVRAIALEAARMLDARRASDIVIYALSGLSDVTDYFVVATGEHRVHLQALARDLIKHFRGRGLRPLGVEGLDPPEAYAAFEEPEPDSRPRGVWTLIDFADCVLHLFDRELRAYYDLDLLWGDAPKVEWKENDKRL